MSGVGLGGKTAEAASEKLNEQIIHELEMHKTSWDRRGSSSSSGVVAATRLVVDLLSSPLVGWCSVWVVEDIE